MQRKASKSTRTANAIEKAWTAKIKQMPCCVCERDGPSIADHVLGSTAKIKYNFETVLVGHWLIIPLCQFCDSVKTGGSHRAFVNKFGRHQVIYWLEIAERYSDIVPGKVIDAVNSRHFG